MFPAALFVSLGERVATSSFAEFRTYLTWTILRASVRDLPRAFRDVDDAFYRDQLDRQVPPDRRTECIVFTRAAVPESVGQLYVSRYFSAERRDDATRHVESIQRAFLDHLPDVKWLDADARRWAEEKTREQVLQIGYPDVEVPDEGVETTRGDLVANHRSAAALGRRRLIASLGKPVNRNAWPWDASTTNAAHIPGENAMNVPAGVLQSPLYSAAYPAVLNLGALGCVVGHELTHAYDTSGSNYGIHGESGDFWSSGVSNAFAVQADCLREQYGKYEVLPGVRVDGDRTLNENIGDLGGVRLAYLAYRGQARNPRATSLVSGLTDAQAFFVRFGQFHCAVATDEFSKQLAAADPHAPGRFRVNGTLGNLPEFAEAFGCKSGDAMVRKDRCEVW